MAATTGGADPTSNLLMAHYANTLERAGQAAPNNAYDMPFPIGGRYASGNMAMAGRLRGQEITAAGNPKRFNFQNNFLGHDRATVDEQMSGLFRPGLAQPEWYGPYEAVIDQLAAKRGVSPRDFQDVAWAGAKGAKTKGGFAGKPMIAHVNDAVERTARLTGLSPQEVVRRGLVRAEMPLYAGGRGGRVAAWIADGQDQGQ